MIIKTGIRPDGRNRALLDARGSCGCSRHETAGKFSRQKDAEGVLSKTYDAEKAKNPDIAVAVPGTNIDSVAFGYLKALYQNGLKNCSDVLDLHTYGGNPENNPGLPGYPKGAPEILFRSVNRLNALLKKYGDENKDKISTEYGYTDGQIANPIGFPISRGQIAQFLTRGLIIHNVLGSAGLHLFVLGPRNEPGRYRGPFRHGGLLSAKETVLLCRLHTGRTARQHPARPRMKGTDEKVVYGYNYRDVKDGSITAVIRDGRGDYSGTFRTEPGKAEEKSGIVIYAREKGS